MHSNNFIIESLKIDLQNLTKKSKSIRLLFLILGFLVIILIISLLITFEVYSKKYNTTAIIDKIIISQSESRLYAYYYYYANNKIYNATYYYNDNSFVEKYNHLKYDTIYIKYDKKNPSNHHFDTFSSHVKSNIDFFTNISYILTCIFIFIRIYDKMIKGWIFDLDNKIKTLTNLTSNINVNTNTITVHDNENQEINQESIISNQLLEKYAI